CGFRRRLELRIAQDRAQLRHLADGSREVGELFVHAREPARLLRRLEERLRVNAVRDAQFVCSSSCEKSSVWIASSIRRRWSSRSSTLPVTFVAATSDSSATSQRICQSARCDSTEVSHR